MCVHCTVNRAGRMAIRLPSWVSREIIETGKYAPSLPPMFKFARLFGLAINSIFVLGEE